MAFWEDDATTAIIVRQDVVDKATHTINMTLIKAFIIVLSKIVYFHQKGKGGTPEASLPDDLCFALGHMSEFNERPESLDEEIFDLLFKSAEIVNSATRERKEYIKDMTTERDIRNQIAFAANKGRQEGELLARQDIACKLPASGQKQEEVSSVTLLSLEEGPAVQQN